MTKPLHESITLAEAATTAPSGRMSIQIITPGLGSSGYYSTDVLKEAAKNKIIPAGTQMFFDHASESERMDRPERSVKDIAAVLTEDAKWTGDALVAEARVVGPYRELLADLAEHIGVSISGSATDITIGEVDGRQVPIIQGLAAVDSVDFVTKAGRGGKVLEVLESARFVREATASDRARQLSDVIRATYSGPGVYAWVRDQDAERKVVWFEVCTDGGLDRTYEQTYDVAANDVDVALTGQPTEVRRVTTYVPATRPGSSTATQESEEDTMPNIQIDEAEHRSLVEAAGRVTALEERATTAEAERDEARRELAETRRTTHAGQLVTERATEHGVTFTVLETRGLLADLPAAEDGTLDEAAFTTRVDEAAATKKADAGEGRVHSNGLTTTTTTREGEVTRKDTATAIAEAFGRTPKEA